jgi:hypothetical protein
MGLAGHGNELGLACAEPGIGLDCHRLGWVSAWLSMRWSRAGHRPSWSCARHVLDWVLSSLDIWAGHDLCWTRAGFGMGC